MTIGRAVRDRLAAQSAMETVVLEQRCAEPPNAIARLFGRDGLTPAARLAFDDALGELLVGDLLENLGRQWDVLHDLPLDRGTIDHVLIGPTGVFAVSVLATSVRDIVLEHDLIVGGEVLDAADRAVDRAAEVSARLATGGATTVVRPVLVLIGRKRPVVRHARSDVVIVSVEGLQREVTAGPRTLDGAEVARLSAVAEDERTWPPAAPGSVDVLALHRDFAVVRGRVRAARARAASWSVAITLAVFCSLWVTVASLVAVLVGS